MSFIERLIVHFQTDDIDIVHALLVLAIVAIVVLMIVLRRQMQVERRLRRRVAANRDCVLNLLGKATDSFKNHLDLAAFIQFYTDYSARSLKAQSAAYFKFDKATRTVHAEAVVGLFPVLPNTPESAARSLRDNPQKLQEYLLSRQVALNDTPFVETITQQLSLIVRQADVGKRLDCTVGQCWGMIMLPLVVGSVVHGVLALANRMDRKEFDGEDFHLARNLGEMAGVVVGHILSFQEIQEKRVVDGQLRTAEEIIKHLLPHDVPKSSKFDIAVQYQPAFRLGGDYYDFMRIDDTHLGILMADVSGKGIPAGLVMATTRSLFAVLAKDERSPCAVLRKLNSHLLDLIPDDMFISMTYAVLDEATGGMVFARAGHEPMLCCGPQHDAEKIGTEHGVVVGMLDDDAFAGSVSDEHHLFHPKDLALFYTDGLTEAQNEKGEELGRSHVMLMLRQVCGFGVNDAMRSLTHRLRKFVGSAPVYDDTTILLIKVK